MLSDDSTFYWLTQLFLIHLKLIDFNEWIDNEFQVIMKSKVQVVVINHSLCSWLAGQLFPHFAVNTSRIKNRKFFKKSQCLIIPASQIVQNEQGEGAHTGNLEWCASTVLIPLTQ